MMIDLASTTRKIGGSGGIREGLGQMGNRMGDNASRGGTK